MGRVRDGAGVAIAGDIITHGVRSRAISSIGRVLGGASERAAAAGDDVLRATAREPFTLLEHSPATVERFAERFRRDLLWTDEGNCFNRAMFGAHLLGDMTRTTAAPTADAFAGAIAVSAHAHQGGTYTGGFHAALAVKVRGMDELQVLDLLPGNPTLKPLSEWTVNPEPLVLRPYAGTGLWNGVSMRSNWVGPQFFDGARDLLTQTWNAAADYGVTVRPR